MTASAAYLIVAVIGASAGSNWFFQPYPQPDMETCRQNIAASKTDIAKGGDAEAGVVMFCSSDDWPTTLKDFNTGAILKRERKDRK
jgi:hypothetical protein